MATSGGKILIHTPFNASNEESVQGTKGLGIAANFAHNQNKAMSDQIRFLNTNKEINSLEVGALDPNRPNELLFIGSETNLLAYDLEYNSDVFDHEVPDGLSCLKFGEIQGVKGPVIIVGGDCSITGLDQEANDKFWTVTGDVVTSMELLNWSNSGQKDELVVGTADFAIRVFKEAELIFDINEEAGISQLQKIKTNIFGYALSNGSYGVYYSRKRLWKQCQSAKVTAMVGLDFETDGQMHLAIGFENGDIEIRQHRKGNLVHKVNLASV